VAGLDDVVGRPLDVPEVDERDVVAEPTDRRGDVDAHRRDVPLTEGHPVGRRVDDREDPLVRLRGGDDASHPADRRERRVVGV
jgi:hypothetical protein